MSFLLVGVLLSRLGLREALLDRDILGKAALQHNANFVISLYWKKIPPQLIKFMFSMTD